MSTERAKGLSTTRRLPVALSVAGSDSGAGAGIQADLLTFSALGVFGTTAITCLTAQNPNGVAAVHAAPASVVRSQIESIVGYFTVRAAKTGMLFDAATVDIVARTFAKNPRIPLVVDPVMVSTSGSVLLQPDAIEVMRRRLFPRANLITPNLDEAAALLGYRATQPSELVRSAVSLAREFCAPVLLKGGHLPGDRLHDVLAFPAGHSREFVSTRIHGVDTHGSGCTLSAAITACLAKGFSITDSVVAARKYLRGGLRRPLTLGRGRFIAH